MCGGVSIITQPDLYDIMFNKVFVTSLSRVIKVFNLLNLFTLYTIFLCHLNNNTINTIIESSTEPNIDLENLLDTEATIYYTTNHDL